MAKIKVPFNNKNYSVDEQSLSSASDSLKSHLSTTMSGSGATINFGGTSYNVDSAKLLAATNDFVSHLGIVAGNGYKVIVNGTEYSVGSDKVAGAVSDLEIVLGGLHSEDGGSGGSDETVIFAEQVITTAHFDDFDFYGYVIVPPSFSLTVGEKYKVLWDGQLYEVEAADCSAITGEVAIGNGTAFGLSGNNEPFIIVYTSDSDVTFIALADTASTSHTVAIYKVTSGNDGSGSGSNSISGVVPQGAYYANLATGTFYSEMPATVSEGDVFIYGDYMYQYNSQYSGWMAILAKEGLGIEAYIPNYPLTHIAKSSYDNILTSINGVNVTIINEFTYSGCGNLVSVIIPDSIIIIDAQSFMNCKKLKSVVFGANSQLTEIGDVAFYNCESLTSIDIPASVTSIRHSTFDNCINLTTITYGGTVAEWNAIIDGLNGQAFSSLIPATNVICSNGEAIFPKNQ